MSQGRYRSYTQTHHGQISSGEQLFTCVQCGLAVTCHGLVSGVQNRNHCPYCLWSRHMDWRAAGDRLSACRAPMHPVGLSIKRGRNKYASELDGELMIIHQCSTCAKLAINRIAADDGENDLLALFERSCQPAPGFQAELRSAGITLLTNKRLLRRRLFGNAEGHG